MPKPEVKFGPCCFCGKDILEHDPDPCRVTVETVNGLWQVWSCHAECFKTRLAKEIDGEPGSAGFFDPAHF